MAAPSIRRRSAEVSESSRRADKPPYVDRRPGSVTPLPMTGGTTIGAKPGLPYNEDVLEDLLTLALGDAIFLYTDGATTG